MEDMIVKQEEKNSFWKILGQILFILAICSIAVTVTLYMEIDIIESFSKTLSIMLSAIFILLWLVVYLLFDKSSIPKAVWITALVLSLLCVVGVKNLCSFSISKWNAHPNLRPLMGQELCYASTRYNESIDDVSKETHPNFLGQYNRSELEAIFRSDRNYDAKSHVKVVLGPFAYTNDYDIYFAYTDYDGTEYWIVATYCRPTDTGDFTRLVCLDVVPEGTVIDYSDVPQM